MIGTSEVTTIKADERHLRLIRAGNKAGAPREQVHSFVTYGYTPIKGFWPFHSACREVDGLDGIPIVALGGKRGPGKSHATIAQVGLDDCQRVPGLKVLFLRKVMKSAKESLEDLARRVFGFIECDIGASRVIFTNGSTIILGGYYNEKEIDKYLGIEYDLIVIEEVTQISKDKKDKITGSCRTSKPGWPPRIYMSTNADGIGLTWFKKELVKPAREKREKNTRFFDVSHITNPFIGKGYDQWLGTLTGALGKAWREGDWDAFAGMAFPTWSHDDHVITVIEAARRIEDHWVHWRCTDWGSAAPWACLWLAKNPDTGQIIVYNEAYQVGLTNKQQARTIVTMTDPNREMRFTYADPSMWSKKARADEWYSAADEYEENGVPLTKGDNDRINGKRKVDSALATQDNGEPGMLVAENCVHLIEQMENLPSDETRPEDVDTDAEDHSFDALKYGLTNEKKLLPPPPPNRQASVNPMSRSDNL